MAHVKKDFLALKNYSSSYDVAYCLRGEEIGKLVEILTFLTRSYSSEYAIKYMLGYERYSVRPNKEVKNSLKDDHGFFNKRMAE